MKNKIIKSTIFALALNNISCSQSIIDETYNKVQDVIELNATEKCCITLKGVKQIISGNVSSYLSKKNISLLIDWLEKNNQDNTLFYFRENDDNLYYTKDVDLNGDIDGIYVININSNVLIEIKKFFIKEELEKIEKNTKYVIIIPRIYLKSKPNTEIFGLSVGENIVFISGNDFENSKRLPIDMGETLIHEADHEDIENNGLSRLKKEKISFYTSNNYVKRLRKQAQYFPDNFSKKEVKYLNDAYYYNLNILERIDFLSLDVFKKILSRDLNFVYPRHIFLIQEFLLDYNNPKLNYNDMLILKVFNKSKKYLLNHELNALGTIGLIVLDKGLTTGQKEKKLKELLKSDDYFIVENARSALILISIDIK